ncbi:MAG: glycosyltransferase [Crocinitomicaceae bacterium]
MPINILYLSYDGMTDPLGQSQVLPYLVGLTKKGFRFHLISFEKEERFSKFREEIQAICDQNQIIWHPLSYTKKPPLISTIWDVIRMRKKAFQLHRVFNFSLIHCRSYISALIGQMMQRKWGIKFLFDMRGFWADERIDGNIWSLNNPVFKVVYNFFKRKEKEFFLESDYVVSLTYNGKNEIISWQGFEQLKNKIEVIPCCADLEKFNPDNINLEKKNVLKTELNINNDDFVLGYVGSIGTWYMLDEMLSFFKVLLKSKPNAIFLFVSGESQKTIFSKAAELGIAEDRIRVKSVLHHDVATCILLFSASIFFIRPTFSKKASSPTKQGELMAMGVPVICNGGVGDTERVVREYHSGLVIEDFNDESYQLADLSFSDFDRTITMKGAAEFYGLNEGVDRYFSVYQKIKK